MTCRIPWRRELGDFLCSLPPRIQGNGRRNSRGNRCRHDCRPLPFLTTMDPYLIWINFVHPCMEFTFLLRLCYEDFFSPSHIAYQIYGRYQIHVDGLFLEDTPTNLYRSRDFNRCPIMAGYNKDEGTLTPYFSYHGYWGQPHHPHISLWVKWRSLALVIE